jgi:NADH-quinone oxidoreductase subunit N
MAGFPPTLGFISKFYLYLDIVICGNYELIVFCLGTNLISSFYYLRIIFTMFFEDNLNFFLCSKYYKKV